MTGAGFYERKTIRPTGLALVIALHAAALAGLVLIKGPEIIQRAGPTIIYDVPPERQPEPEPQRPPENQTREHRSRIDTPRPAVEMPPVGLPIANDPEPQTLPPIGQAGEQFASSETAELPPPVRIDAEFDPRHAGDM